MSLINKVLSDLEDRHAFPSLQPQSVLSDLRSAQEYAHTRGAGSRPVVGLGVLLMVVAAALLLGREPPPLPPVAKPFVVAPATAPMPAAAPRAERRVEPVAATELQLKLDSLPVPAAGTEPVPVPAAADAVAKLLNFDVASEGNAAAIRLVFNHPPRYSLHILEQPSRLLVQMPKIELSPLRDLDPAGLIDRLRFGGDHDVSKLIFDLNQPVEIAGARVVSGPGDVYRLEIRLSAAAAPQEAAAGIDRREETFASVPVAMPEAAPEPARTVVAPAMELVRHPLPGAGSAESDFQQGANAYRAGDMAAAIDHFHRAITAEPRHLQARRFLVTVLADQGDVDNARRFAEDGLGYDPRDPVLLRTLARIHFEQGDAGTALQVLARGQPALEDDPDYYALLAAILQRQAKHLEAADIYGRLLRFDPQRGVWWGGFGISMEALGRPVEARNAFERAQRDASAPANLRRYAAERVAAIRAQSG